MTRMTAINGSQWTGSTVCTHWSTGPSLRAVEALTVRVGTRRNRPYNRRFTATMRSPTPYASEQRCRNAGTSDRANINKQ